VTCVEPDLLVLGQEEDRPLILLLLLLLLLLLRFKERGSYFCTFPAAVVQLASAGCPRFEQFLHLSFYDKCRFSVSHSHILTQLLLNLLILVGEKERRGS
jgi:hypothetical protein